MNSYTVPADFKADNIIRINELNHSFTGSKVVEIYGQLTDGGANSGRSIDTLPQIGIQDLEKYINALHDSKIKFNYTINQSCSSNQEFSKKTIREITELVNRLWNIGAAGVTVSLPPIIELVKDVRPELEIKASAICEINSVHRALFYKKLGADRIVVDTDTTRKFDTLKSICKAFGEGVEIIVTNMCHATCPYKMFHYNHTAHKNANHQDVEDYYENRCFLQYAEEANSGMRLNWIRPEDIHLYHEAGISCFKLDGRDRILQGDYLKTIYHYFSGKFEGNLFDLLYFFGDPPLQMRYLDNRKLDGFIQAFYDNPNHCSGICDECGYCATYIGHDHVAKSAARACYITAKNVRKVDRFKTLIQGSELHE